MKKEGERRDDRELIEDTSEDCTKITHEQVMSHTKPIDLCCDKACLS